MATRSSGTKVTRTSGQGVSRRGYQSAYELGQRGTGGMADFRAGTQDEPKRRNYGKSGSKDIVVSYDDTIEPSDLADVVALGKDRDVPKASVASKRGRAKEFK